jgi:uroporphyrinogen-III decarboxylase
VELFLTLSAPLPGHQPDCSGVLAAEQALGDRGIVMIDTPDPLCIAAGLFEMGEFTVIACQHEALFHRLLEYFAVALLPQTEAVARALPGRLWRIYGPEYASAPYLHPHQFKDYVVGYDTEMVQAIQKYGGFARLHSHGRLRNILEQIVSTGCSGLDPIEPPPQGDVELWEVREKYGQQLVLFGNLELSDIEGLPTAEFEHKVVRALREGTRGEGRGFVLMPTACPYGRVLAPLSLRNYEKIIEMVERWGG